MLNITNCELVVEGADIRCIDDARVRSEEFEFFRLFIQNARAS